VGQGFPRSKATDRTLLAGGLILVAGGIALNPWTVSLLLGRNILALSHKLMIGIVEAAIIALGLLIVLQRKSIDPRGIALGALSGGLCLSLFLAYDFSRAFSLPGPQATYLRDVHVPDDHLGWKPKPSSRGRHFLKDVFDVTYEIDANGFKSIDNDKNARFNIYFLGDSFTFGHGVSNADTFSNIIADEYLTDDVGVYNLGVMGYGIVQMYQRFLDIEERIHKGDLVVFTPLSEDIVRNFESVSCRVQLLALILPQTRRNAAELPTTIGAYPSFNGGTMDYRKIEAPRSPLDWLRLRALNAPFTGQLFRAVLVKRPPMRDLIEESIALVSTVRSRVEAKGARFALIFLPRTEECLSRKYELDVSRFEHYDIIDDFPSVRDEIETLTFRRDLHWNAYGHRIAARAIVGTLVRNNLLEGKDLKKDPGPLTRASRARGHAPQ
jgi:hypothetical protein